MNLKHLFVKQKYILKHLNFKNHRNRLLLYDFFLPCTSLHMLNLLILRSLNSKFVSKPMYFILNIQILLYF